MHNQPHNPVLRLYPFLHTPALALAMAGLLVAGGSAAGQNLDVGFVRGIEIETRGPIHEAFAEPIVFDAEPPLVVPAQPPPPIQEIPPNERPAGDYVTWIPGYWSWDEDRNAFIWLSGIWRRVPPGRQFIPGYWTETVGGYQWVPGFWLHERHQFIEYLPEPPPPIQVEPVGGPPGPDYIWVPGVWLWQEGEYLWRPGYWMPPQPDWVWVPAHYHWSPSGYIYISGYWDYPLPERGLLFAPVYIDRAVMARPAFVYTPNVVLNVGLIADHLFARPRYRHYYFGDYYAPEYRRVGIVPVYTFHHAHSGYSPTYAHRLAVHRRTDPDWEQRFVREFELRQRRAEARPPRTWAALRQTLDGRGPDGRRLDRDRADTGRSPWRTLARTLTEAANARDLPLRLERIAPDQREDARRRVAQLDQYRTQRRRLELSSADRGPLRAGPEALRATRDGQTGRDVESRLPARIQGRPIGPEDQADEQRRTRVQPPGQSDQTRQVRPGQRDRRAEPSEQRDREELRERLRSMRLDLHRSPVAGRPLKELDRSQAPPARPRVPEIDRNARPERRGASPREQIQPRERPEARERTRGDDRARRSDEARESVRERVQRAQRAQQTRPADER